VLNALERGERCVVTTRDGRIVRGWYRGIEVSHGDRSALIESKGHTYSIAIELMLTAATQIASSPDRTYGSTR
jgi:hypothetical protein